jgi:hypothetical protein
MDELSISAGCFSIFCVYILVGGLYASFIVILVVGSAPYASGSGKIPLDAMNDL